VIGLDTNVLLRFITQDDQQQSPLADATMASLTTIEPGWVAVATVLEFVWAMSKSMRLPKPMVCNALDRMLTLDTIVMEQQSIVSAAVQQYRSTRADFADCLIAASARAAGCSKTVTFDRIAARDTGMELIA
jgi:predicted nucleic-acid-binding protein